MLNLRRLFFMLGVLGTVTLSSQAQTLRYNTGDPLQFGIGYNTLTGEYAGTCTVPVLPGDIHEAGEGGPGSGQLSRWELTSVEDLVSLSDKLDFSASASASFAAGSVSASTQYTKSRSFNSFHEFLYLSASVANTTRIWTAPALPKEMAQLRQTNPLAFLDRCGDTFVKTITSGGELTAVLDLSTSAQEDKSSLSIAISGNYATAEGRAALHEQLSKTLLNRQTQVTVVRAGGAGALPSYSAEDLITASLSFGTTVQQHPYPMLAQLASYNIITPSASLTAAQEIFIRPLFREYRRAMQYWGDLSYIRGHAFEFRTFLLPSNLAGENLKEAMRVLTDSRPASVVSADFIFQDIDKKAVEDAIDEHERYVEALSFLVKSCLDDPKTGCKGTVPARPHRLDNLVRVFPIQRPWDTATGPVSIVLDSAWVCKVIYIEGTWRIADAPNAPIAPCDALPKAVMNGYIIAGGFDSYYLDNHGTCRYDLLCFRR